MRELIKIYGYNYALIYRVVSGHTNIVFSQTKGEN